MSIDVQGVPTRAALRQQWAQSAAPAAAAPEFPTPTGTDGDLPLALETVVRAGRPACPFCGGPVDEDGHICPRANGYKR